MAILTLISYLSPYISPLASNYIPLLGLIYPALFVLNIAFFISWVFTKWTYSLVSFCTLLIGFSASQRLIAFNSPKVIKSDRLINVVSYNVASGSAFKEKDAFYDFIASDFSNAVIFLQETTSTINQTLKSVCKGKHIIHIPKKRSIIISPYKVLDKGSIDFKGQYNSGIWADILFKGEKIRIYSIHLQSNNVTTIANDVRAEGELIETETWGNVATMMKRYATTAQKRTNQVQKIIEHASKIDYPVIIGGDFNDVPQSYVYAQMVKEYTDAFYKRGNGMGTSFNGAIPSLRIDYIFVSDDFKVLTFDTQKEDYSDHYPIQTQLLVK